MIIREATLLASLFFASKMTEKLTIQLFVDSKCQRMYFVQMKWNSNLDMTCIFLVPKPKLHMSEIRV